VRHREIREVGETFIFLPDLPDLPVSHGEAASSNILNSSELRD
jgi:hypothetical protein